MPLDLPVHAEIHTRVHAEPTVLFDFLDDPGRLGPDLCGPFEAGGARQIGAVMSACRTVKCVCSQASDMPARGRDPPIAPMSAFCAKSMAAFGKS
jgi:hypothetical protein